MFTVEQKSSNFSVGGQLIGFDGGGADNELILKFRTRVGDVEITIPNVSPMVIKLMQKVGVNNLKGQVLDLDRNRLNAESVHQETATVVGSGMQKKGEEVTPAVVVGAGVQK